MPGVDLRTRDCGGHAVVELRGELAAVAVREPDIIVDLAALEFYRLQLRRRPRPG